jgi:N-acetylglucosaminyldiphosphoundecaprenol N-acetyl-beta-D-mannosaminyltransferase
VSVPALAVRQVLGVQIHAVRIGTVLDACHAAIRSRRPLTLGVVNVAKLVLMRRDALLRESVLGADLVVAAGLPVVWASRLLGDPLPERVAGIDLFEELLKLADRESLSVYLLGARADVLAELVARIQRELPGVRIAGSRDGYFQEHEAAQVAQEIEAAGPDMLFVGISTPKKELFLGRFGPELSVPVRHGVGGSFDVLAGKTRRAPPLMQRWGLEWLYRMLQEPGRMWKRYLTTNTTFAALVLREWLRRRRSVG